MPTDYFPEVFSRINFTSVLFTFAFVVYWIYVFIIIYHLVRFGIGPKPKLFALVFLAGAVILFTISVYSFGQIDLTNTLEKLKTKDFKTLPRLNVLTPFY